MCARLRALYSQLMTHFLTGVSAVEDSLISPEILPRAVPPARVYAVTVEVFVNCLDGGLTIVIVYDVTILDVVYVLEGHFMRRFQRPDPDEIAPYRPEKFVSARPIVPVVRYLRLDGTVRLGTESFAEIMREADSEKGNIL